MSMTSSIPYPCFNCSREFHYSIFHSHMLVPVGQVQVLYRKRYSTINSTSPAVVWVMVTHTRLKPSLLSQMAQPLQMLTVRTCAVEGKKKSSSAVDCVSWMKCPSFNNIEVVTECSVLAGIASPLSSLACAVHPKIRGGRNFVGLTLYSRTLNCRSSALRTMSHVVWG